MADPLDPDQALRKRLTAQLAPQAQTAEAGASTADTPLSAPVDAAPFPSAPNPGDRFNGTTWVGGGASGVTPSYGTNPAPIGQSTPYAGSEPFLEPPPSNQPIIPGGLPVPGAPHPGWPTMPPVSTPAPPPPAPPPLSDPVEPAPPVGSPDRPQMVIGPDDFPIGGLGPGKPTPTFAPGPVGSPDDPRMTIGPTDWTPQPPSLSKSLPTLLPEQQQSNLVVPPQQQLRRRLLSQLRRPRLQGRF